MTFGSLFAGIGGFDLGFERAGLVCQWQVEIDPWFRRVLAKHWPDVRRHDDVRTFPPDDGGDWRVDVICGGFPCQDISYVGKGAGIAEGTRSGLWSEIIRIVRVVRPRFLIVENVAALLDRGLGRVLGDLAACGFDAEWECLPAGAFGAVHCRDRVFLLARDTDRDHEREIGTGPGQWAKTATLGSLPGESPIRLPWQYSPGPGWRGHWSNEPAVGRVAHGVPSRVDRLRGLGNAVIPQVAEFIGRRLMEFAAGGV
jgi:DNA (cytosine-5)-methyltransferase 1